MRPKRIDTAASLIFEVPAAPTTMLDVVDQLLNSGVTADGDVTLGLAGVDLIYLRLSALLCAADRVLPLGSVPPIRRSRGRRGRVMKTRS
jgi:hypothetical protein